MKETVLNVGRDSFLFEEHQSHDCYFLSAQGRLNAGPGGTQLGPFVSTAELPITQLISKIMF